MIDKGDKELFQVSKILDETPVKIKGKIFRIDGHSLTGRLTILSSNDINIPIGKEYAYDLLDEKKINACNKSFMKEAEIIALKELIFNPSDLNKSVSRLKIIDVELITNKKNNQT